MIYVQQSLVPDEKIVFGGYFHWMYTVSAALWIVIGLLMSFVILYAGIQLQFDNLPSEYYLRAVWELNPLIRLGALFAFLFGLIKFGIMLAIKASTEIAVTNRRLIMKRGIIARHTDEMSVDRIEGVIVVQSLLGRLLHYGRVVVRGMGVGAIVLPGMISNPIAFRQAVERAREM